MLPRPAAVTRRKEPRNCGALEHRAKLEQRWKWDRPSCPIVRPAITVRHALVAPAARRRRPYQRTYHAGPVQQLLPSRRLPIRALLELRPSPAGAIPPMTSPPRRSPTALDLPFFCADHLGPGLSLSHVVKPSSCHSFGASRDGQPPLWSLVLGRQYHLAISAASEHLRDAQSAHETV